MPGPIVKMKIRPEADPAIPFPSYQTAGAAGADIAANFPEDFRDAGVTISPWGRAIIPTGYDVEIENGWEIQIRPRSGLAAKHGISIVNTPGTIDCDYRDQIKVMLINLSDEPFTVRHGDRIAQCVMAPIHQAKFVPADALSETARGRGGLGSTGTGSVSPEVRTPRKGDMIRHIKRGTTYQVMGMAGIATMNFLDGKVISGRELARIMHVSEFVPENDDRIGVQISDGSAKGSSWVIYRAIDKDHDDDLPDLWMRHASEFEGRFEFL